MRIRAWPEPRALVREGAEDWKTFRPEFRFLEPKPAVVPEPAVAAGDPDTAKKQAFEALRAAIPPPIAAALERFQSHQWNLLELLSRKPEAGDLLAVNPALAFCLANCDQFRRWTGPSPAACASFLVGKRQRDILGWLGFPASESAARIFRKILPEAISPSAARVLRHAWRSEPGIVKLLGHQRTINAGVLALLTNLKLLPAVSPRLVMQVGADSRENHSPRTAEILLDILHMLWGLRRPSRMPRFASIEAAVEYHDALLQEYTRVVQEAEAAARARRAAARQRPAPARRRSASRGKPAPFPPPPLRGTYDIVPLTSPEQLREEGRTQRNCVGSYASRVRSGALYVYSVFRPERATLAIRRGADGSWKIDQLRAEGNRPVSQFTEETIRRWLSLHSISV